MKTLSIRQPWATLIMLGEKDIEIRTWNAKHRGPLLIHTGKTSDGPAIDHFKILPEHYGYVLGYANLVNIKRYDNIGSFRADRNKHKNWRDPDKFPLFGWVFEDIKRIEPFQFPGKLSFFDVPVDADMKHGLSRFGITQTKQNMASCGECDNSAYSGAWLVCSSKGNKKIIKTLEYSELEETPEWCPQIKR